MPAFKEIRSNKRKEKYERACELLFWKTEYTRRKFYLDYPPDSPQLQALATHYTNLFSTLKAWPYRTETSADSLRVINAATGYYNNIVTRNPKELFFMEQLPAENYKNIATLIIKNEADILAIRNLALVYGYFPDALLSFTEGEELVKIAAKHTWPQNITTFPRKNDDAGHPCRINYVDRLTKSSFFEAEQDGVAYLYINPLADLANCNAEVEKLSGYLTTATGLPKISHSPKENSLLQLCIDMDFLKKHLKDAQSYCRHAIKKYSLTYSINPYDEKENPDWNSMHWVIYGVDGEQTDPRGRAIGLWLWELVDVEKQEISAAIKTVRASKHAIARSAIEDNSPYYRDLKLARRCIEAMQVLKLAGA